MDQNVSGSRKTVRKTPLWVDITLIAIATIALIVLFFPVCEVNKWVYSAQVEPQYVTYWNDPFQLNIQLGALWADILPIIAFVIFAGISILDIIRPNNPKPKLFRVLSYIAFGMFVVLALACAINAQCGVNSLAY